MFICFCYIPPKDSVYFKKVDINLFDLLKIDIRHYSDFGKVAIVGDLNARTGLSNDHFENCENIDKYIHCLQGADIYDYNECLVGRRFSLDEKLNSSGMRLLQICKHSCLRIMNGRLGNDAGIGNYTFQSVQGWSLIDNVLLPPCLFDIVSSFIIHDISVFSDHVPIQFSLRAKLNSAVPKEQCEIKKLVWDNNKSNEFKDVLCM